MFQSNLKTKQLPVDSPFDIYKTQSVGLALRDLILYPSWGISKMPVTWRKAEQRK